MQSFIYVPPHSIRERNSMYMNIQFYKQVTLQSRYINVYPNNTHKRWGEIIDAWDAGIKVRITRLKVDPSVSCRTAQLGEIQFIPWSKCGFSYCSKEEAEGMSILGYGSGNHITWQEFAKQHNIKEK